ncbi:MAG TPA: endonuclease MutS2 [Chloroflexota bacterium]
MIDDKALRTLEFPKILGKLEEYASFSAGKEAVQTLRPAVDLHTASAWIRQTSEARLLLETRPATHLGGAHDIRQAVQRAAVGAVLTPRELLEIGETLRAAARIRSSVLTDDLDIPWLRSRAQRLAENRELTEALEQTFSDRGEILDSASPALRRIRLDMQTAQGRLMDRLNSMVTSSEHRTALQEPIVTMRNGRYVIPVRHDSRAKIPGIVHDQSASGQTVFVEPLAVTELNNRLKELQLVEEREIERILRALSERVATQAPELRDTVDALIDVDVAFAKAKYASALRATAPRLNEEGRLNLISARHPLLQGDVVPISIWLGTDFRVLVITGPNTGGKTVALKTVGLLTLMAQAGMHIPSEAESDVAVFPKVFADIGDEQSIEQSLSTFSSHMRNIISMLPEIDAKSLVLLDELGAGTDPAEGAALARALLSSILDSGARAVVTTHYSELKTFAHEQEEVENGSVEFDVETLSPTYRLIVGLPGRSQALAIARRLGMPQGVLAVARQNVSAGAVRVEKLLAQIQNERSEIGQLFQRAQELHSDARKLRDRVQNELRSIKREREDILATAREEAASVVRDIRSRLRAIEQSASGSASRREQREFRTQVDEAQSSAAVKLGPVRGEARDEEQQIQPLRPGATVQVMSLQQQGTIVSLRDGEAEVQLGQFTMRVPTDDLQIVVRKHREPERTVEFHATREAPALEIDVRGWRAEDALREVDQYLHDNYVHGQDTVRILHGKGTGALRKAIREQLDVNPLVKSHATEKRELGGEGVTVVKLAV